MADRSVIYRLVADVAQFKMGMATARSETAKTGAELEASGKKSAKSFSAVEMAAGGAALMIAGRAVTAAADFEQAMSGVQAATHESAASMDSLRQAAMDAGAQTKFSATEAAAGIENLAKAGVSTSDILNGGLTGALDLAAAGNLEVGQAAEIAATALTQFNLAGEDVPHVADLLAAGAGKAQGEVTDLSQALNQAGLVAGQMGLSIEETTGTLSAFASAGLLGSDAGTSLKTMLLRLANPSKEARKEMERFGISAYDAQGNMLPMADIAEQIKTGFQGQSQATRDAALATIFGSDAIRAANVLYAEGAAGITDWTAKVDDAGFAAETAAIKMDNLRGDLEILMGSIETNLIGAGDGSQESLRGTTQAATSLLDVLNEINSTGAVSGATDSLGLGGISPDVLELGVTALKKTKFEIFGVDDATKEAAKSADEAAEAEKLLAAETTRLGQSAEFAAGATQQSAEKLKAQADALEDAREAAHKTAGGFVNLGGSLNDAKKSLGQWINQMANQADALRNFRLNAEEAADKGLRRGLIDALREAGPEGALRMKQLSNATQSEINKANAAWQAGQREINKYVNEVTRASNMPDVYTNLYVTTTRRTVNEGGPGPRLEAAGGPIYGPGTATSDSIPAMLSNGEYVVRAAAVQQYGVGFFDRANAMRLAGGGSVSKKRRTDGGFDTEADDAARERREEQAAERQKALDMAEADRIERERHYADEAAKAWMDMLDGQEKATREWLSAAEMLRDGFAASMEATAKGSTAGFQSDLFGSSGSIWGTGGAGPFGALTSDIAGLTLRGDLQAQLAAAGLDGDALSAALTEGSNRDLAALLAGGRIQEFEDLFNQRAALTGTVGTAAGQAAYGAQFASLSTEVANLTAELARINELQNPTSADAAAGYAMQGATIAASVSTAVVNGFNTVARRGTGGY